MRATVVVITTPGHPTLLASRFAIRDIAAYWGERGVHFALTTDPGVAPEGDLAWQHLDVTHVGIDYQRLLARYPLSINGAVTDVSKRRTATHLVTEGDGWDGPVMIKTDANFGGRSDDWGHRSRLLRHPWLHALLDRLPARVSGRMWPGSYPIHASKATVPRWAWRDRRFVIQRFLAERQDGQHAIRRWFFLGESEFAYRALGRDPILLGDEHTDWERVEPPPDLRAARADLGLDYGKIDYGEVDGEVVVYDVNPAVSASGPPDSPVQREMVAALLPGLETFLVRAGR